MVPAESTTIELAKQGDVTAIAAFLNHLLEDKRVVTKVTLKENILQVMLEAEQVPNQQELCALVQKELSDLQMGSVKAAKLYGRQRGEDFPDWQQEVELTNPTQQQSSFWGAIFGAVTGAAEAVGNAAVQTGSTVVETAVNAGGFVGGAIVQTGGAVTGAVVGTAGTVGSATTQAGQAVLGTASGVGSAIANTAVGVGGAIANTAMQTPASVGYLVDLVSQSPQLQELTKVLKMDWLVKLVDQVDIVKAKTHVQKLQKKYPDGKPNQIANRVMLEKALYVGGSGFATSLMPGFASAMLAVDLAATMAVQAEMIYQIACAYGLDLHHPDRKGEVLAIFGLTLGGDYAIKAGLGFARNVPGAGAVIGASSNAVMLYALGHAACQFYEAKLNSLNSQAALAASQAESEKYLEQAVAQEVIMDQILAHLVLAGQPNKTWKEILPTLKTMNFSLASIEVISATIDTPTPLEILLSQINQDFAVPLLAQCQRMASEDGVVTAEEAKVLELITKKLSIAS